MKIIIILSVLTHLLQSQITINGNVSLSGEYVNYDSDSKLWDSNSYTDSLAIIQARGVDISNFNLNDYSSAYIVPGLSEVLSLNLFANSNKWRYAFFSRLQNSDWIKPDDIKNISRLSLQIQYDKQKIVLGDDYVNSHAYAIDQRKLRGLSGQFSLYDDESFKANVKAYGGIIEYGYNVGEPVLGRYQSYYLVQRYQRNLYGAEFNTNWFNNAYEFNFTYLSGKEDTENLLNNTVVYPIENTLIGGSAKVFILPKQMYLQGYFFQSKTDTVYRESQTDFENEHAFGFGLGLDNELFKIEFNGYKVSPNYYSFGQPYIITDREGLLIRNHINLTEVSNISMYFDVYQSNTENNPNVLSLKSNEMQIRYFTPIGDLLNLSLQFLHLGDESDRSAEIFVSRYSNSWDFQFNVLMNQSQIGLLAGSNKTGDDGIYGFTLNPDSTSSPITGLNSDRYYVGFNGYYNFNDDLSVNVNLTYNNLNQQTIDRTNIINVQLGTSYSIIPNELKFIFLSNVSLSDNKLDFKANPNDLSTSKIRYQLFSAINRFNQNFFDASFEYLLSSNIRLTFSYRYDKKDYKYLDSFSVEELRNFMVTMNNPNFFNQKESYSASIFKLTLGYIL